MNPAERPEVIVVGAGLTGSEAAWGLARLGVATLLVTISLDTIATLPGDGWRFAPPAEGLLATLASTAGGPDAWSAQALHRAAKRALEREPALHVLQSTVTGLHCDEAGRVVGVATWEGVARSAPLVALCVGSFLRARLRMGRSVEVAGRLSEFADDDLYEDLLARGRRFETRRLALPGDALQPGYEVEHQVLAAGEVAAGGAVRGLPGLFAYGVCAGAAADLATSARLGVEAAGWLASVIAGSAASDVKRPATAPSGPTSSGPTGDA